jgi:histidinol phosphatase-like enzyme
MTADFFLDKDGVVIKSKYSEKDAFDGFEFNEIKEFSLN